MFNSIHVVLIKGPGKHAWKEDELKGTCGKNMSGKHVLEAANKYAWRIPFSRVNKLLEL